MRSIFNAVQILKDGKDEMFFHFRGWLPSISLWSNNIGMDDESVKFNVTSMREKNSIVQIRITVGRGKIGFLLY